MTNKQRIHAALEGKPVDRPPVTSLYNQLYHLDHFEELTGIPAWRRHEWLTLPIAQHLDLYRRIQAAAHFEILQPQLASDRVWRERQEFVLKTGHAFRHDRETNEWEQLDIVSDSGHANDYHANETQYIFTPEDIDRRLPLPQTLKESDDGELDYVKAVIAAFKDQEFILTGGVIGTLYSCGGHVGQTHLFALLIEQPDLITRLCERILEFNLARIRRLAAAGGDAIYIDDATATSDMISPALYERFSLPYMQAMVQEIHRLGHKAILIYFGGIMDRLDLIARTGADGLSYEASMKGFVNDTASIARRIGDRMTLFSNIDPIAVLQNGTDADLESEIRRQVDAGRAARGFILSTASPITPSTPLLRVQQFIHLAKKVTANTSHCRKSPANAMTKLERVLATLNHQPVDRCALLEQVSYNPGVIADWTEKPIRGFDYTVNDICEVIRQTCDLAMPPIAPRGTTRIERDDGFVIQNDNWTQWHVSRPFTDEHGAAKWLKNLTAELGNFREDPKRAREEYRTSLLSLQSKIGDTVILKFSATWFCYPFDCMGLEIYSYFQLAYPEVLKEFLDTALANELRRVHAVADPSLSPVILIPEDFATKQGPIFAPDYLKVHHYPYIQRLTDAWHEQGIKVLYHSDGNWKKVIPELKACGVDGFYCLEKNCGMDGVELKNQWPELVWAGSIDGVDLLERGTPDQVKAEVTRQIRESHALETGGFFVASSSEINPPIPPANFRALVETVQNTRRT